VRFLARRGSTFVYPYLTESPNIDMSDTLRQDIIFKILKIAKDNSDLNSDDLFNQADSETLSMFNQLMDSKTDNAPS
jgi:hypothetical protein